MTCLATRDCHCARTPRRRPGRPRAQRVCSHPALRRPQAQGRAAELRAALADADADGAGALGCAGLEAALAAVGIKFTRHQLVALARHVDRERRGAVPTEELARLLLGPGE
jgi:hypothetical protein